jgi:multidrug efflux pump subunit AcrA (membrane-fusion protein)
MNNPARSLKDMLSRTRRRKLVATVGVLATLAVIAGMAAGSPSATAQSEEQQVQTTTATVETRDLVEFATISGQLQYGDPVALTTTADGVLVFLPDEGETIERGDVMYVLSDEPEAVDVLNAESQVAGAESQLASALSQLSTLEDGAKTSELAAAQASVLTAERALDNLTEAPKPAEISTAQAQVLAAQQSLEDLASGPNAAESSNAEAQVTKAESAVTSAEGAEITSWNSLNAAQAAYCANSVSLPQACGAGSLPLDASDVSALTDQATAALSSGDPDGIAAPAQSLIASQVGYNNAVANVEVSRQNLESARAALDQLNDAPTLSTVSTAQASLESAQQALADLVDGPDQLSVAEAQANLASAAARLDELVEGATPEELAAARASADSGETGVDLAVRQYIDLLDAEVAPVLMYGLVPMTRDFGPGTTGPDVEQLQANLVHLGYGSELQVDGVYDDATTQVVSAWQADRGAPVTGSIKRDEVVFLSGPVRIDAWTPDTQIGERVGGGGDVTAAPTSGASTSGSATLAEVTPLSELPTDDPFAADDELQTSQQAVAELPVADRALVDTGDEVTVELPDGTEIAGTVSQTAATPTEDPSTGDAFFEIIIILADSADEIWIGTDIDVNIVSDLAEDVTAVPVSALVALVEGGYALEQVNPDGGTDLVAVETGMFADGYVEVTGQVATGAEVVVPE